MKSPYLPPTACVDVTDDMVLATGKFPEETIVEVHALQQDGYRVHRIWENGVEMRKGKPVRWRLLAIHLVLVLCVPLLTPFVGRSALANVQGYRHRVLVLSATPGSVVFV